MALLIINLDKRIGNAQAWRDTFKEQLPDLPIRIWPDAGELKDIEYLAFMHPDFDQLPAFPNLKAMFSRSAGVEDFVKHPKLPKVPLGKVEPPGGDPMMTEYVVMHVLRFHRDMPGLPGGAGESGMAQGADRPARAKARRLPGLRHDGQGAGAGPASRSASRSPRGSARRGRPQRCRSSTAAISSRRSSARPISPSACCR